MGFSVGILLYLTFIVHLQQKNESTGISLFHMQKLECMLKLLLQHKLDHQLWLSWTFTSLNIRWLFLCCL